MRKPMSELAASSRYNPMGSLVEKAFHVAVDAVDSTPGNTTTNSINRTTTPSKSPGACVTQMALHSGMNDEDWANAGNRISMVMMLENTISSLVAAISEEALDTYQRSGAEIAFKAARVGMICSEAIAPGVERNPFHHGPKFSGLYFIEHDFGLGRDGVRRYFILPRWLDLNMRLMAPIRRVSQTSTQKWSVCVMVRKPSSAVGF